MHSDLDMKIPLKIGDIPLSEDPNAPVVDLNAQAFTNNVPYNPGMQFPPGVVPSGPNSAPYMVPGAMPMNPQVPGYPTGGPPVVPSQPGMPNPVGPPTVGFTQPNLYPGAGAMPQFSTPGYPQQNYNAGGVYAPGQPAVNPGQQYPPNYNPNNPVGTFAPPPQPATNPECSQNTSYPPAGYNFSTAPNSTNFTDASSFGNEIKMEQTSFLSHSNKEHNNENNATQFTPLLPSSRKLLITTLQYQTIR